MGEDGRRREAVRRVLSGEPPAGVAKDLRRSEAWVRKWVERFDPAEPAWAESRSRAPRRVANRTPAETEALVVGVRERLAENPWSQVGAVAIAWELRKLGLDVLPSLRTIERILARGGVPRRARRPRRTPKGKAYPEPPAEAPGACQEADLIGPRYLEGAVCFYAMNAVDLGLRKAGIEITPSKSSASVVEALESAWGRLGVPERVKLDNQQALAGAGRRLSDVVRFCLGHGVTPVFIPYSEPWRNPVVEHFNDVFDKSFFRTERFRDLGHLRVRAREFEAFHNDHHRYSAPNGATPNEVQARMEFTPRSLEQAAAEPSDRVEFIRFIRSDAKLRILSVELLMPEAVVYEYVTAVLAVGAQELSVHHQGNVVATFPFPLSK